MLFDSSAPDHGCSSKPSKMPCGCPDPTYRQPMPLVEIQDEIKKLLERVAANEERFSRMNKTAISDRKFFIYGMVVIFLCILVSIAVPLAFTYGGFIE